MLTTFQAQLIYGIFVAVFTTFLAQLIHGIFVAMFTTFLAQLIHGIFVAMFTIFLTQLIHGIFVDFVYYISGSVNSWDICYYCTENMHQLCYLVCTEIKTKCIITNTTHLESEVTASPLCDLHLTSRELYLMVFFHLRLLNQD